MLDELINGYDEDTFCRFLNTKFSGSFSASRSPVTLTEQQPWRCAERLGVVKTLTGPNGANMPLLVVSAKLHDGGTLKERSSRLKQFKFAKQALDQAMSNPSPGIEGVVTQGLFVFYDEQGNFRLSLVYGKAEGIKLVWSTARRLSFHVQAGDGNKTFRDRMALPWSSFDKLKEAFSVEKLTKEFYGRLFAWYQWALSDELNVTYPNDLGRNDDDREINDHIIRLITRLMFVWFLKQKHLVPDNLFDPAALKNILKNFNPMTGDNYYRAILQNLFFATLNSEIAERAFAVDAGNVKDNREHFDIKTLYRYGADFSLTPEQVLKLFSSIPFLNGGLFECLDRGRNYSDGFSREPKNQTRIPNRLFFDPDKGLIPLLQQYNFTVEENSPGDEEVALDPELLGKVFENLLGAYNPETKVAARNATGSFYTPREIVNYMVDESLIAHLTVKCGEENADAIRKLFTGGERPANKSLCDAMDTALVTAKILDPACGSGAFPMGILLRMVELLRILRNIPEDQSVYDLKLELIENCIYGGDIQCIAVQISKLRFFISLVCEQKPTNNPKENYGIHTLPNLETKFVAADSLIGLPKSGDELPMRNVEALKKELWQVRHKHFLARTYQEKKDLRKEDKILREKLAQELEHGGGFDTASAKLMAEWDPYNQNISAPFSDPEWMFNVKDGFDIVIGNPPYGAEFSEEHKELLKKRFDHIVERIRNSYLYFMGISFDISKPNGVVCFILPNEFLFQIYMTKARRFFLDNGRFMFAINVGEDVFDAIVPTCIVSIQKHKLFSYDMPIADLRNCSLEELPERLYTPAFQCVPKESIRSAPNSIFSFDVRSGRLVNRLFSQFEPFENFCDDVANGISTSCDGVYIVSSEKAEQERFEEHFCKPCIRGGQFNRYFCPNDTGDQILYVTSEFDVKKGKRILEYLSGHKPLLIRKSVEKKAGKRDWHILFRSRYEDLFRKPKVIIRQTGDGIIAAVDEVGFYCIDSVNVALVKRQFYSKIYFLTGLLNSRLLNFFYREISQEAGRVLAQVKPQRIRVLPIAEAKQEVEIAITNMVMQIMLEKTKKAGIAADTSALENEIDELVYELYGLTPEEKEIVKGSVSHGGAAAVASDAEESDETDVATAQEPEKKPAKPLSPKVAQSPRKRKATLPPSLPGWD